MLTQPLVLKFSAMASLRVEVEKDDFAERLKTSLQLPPDLALTPKK
jgi:hypothetical protein